MSSRLPSTILLLGLVLACSPESRDGDPPPPVSDPGVSVRCGDTDGDGRFETENIQQCIDAVDETGQKTFRLLPGLTYEALLEDGPYYNDLGFVELDSNTTLDCQGSKIRGIDHLAKAAPSSWGPLWVVTNSDHESNSQHDIWVRDCEIDGGMPASYDEDADPFDHDAYTGFALYGVAVGGIADSHVHDTHHACVYIRDSRDIAVEGNTLTDCGGANNAGSFRQPAVYLFQRGAVPQRRIAVRNNTALRAGTQLYNTRVTEWHAEYRTAWMSEISFESNYGDQDGNGLPCMVLRGARQVEVRGNTCVETAGIITTAASEKFCNDNPAIAVNRSAESSCLEDVSIEDNLLIDSRAESGNGAISVYAYHDGVIVRNNEIRGTTRRGSAPIPCVRWRTPIRNFLLDGLVASGCDGPAIEQAPASLDQIDAPADEAIVFLNLQIDGSEGEGVLLRTRLESIEIDGLEIGGSGREGIRSLGPLVGGTIRNYSIDGLMDPPNQSAIWIEGATDLLLEEGIVQNLLGPAVRFDGEPSFELTISGLTCAQPAFGTGIDQPMTYCVLNEAGGDGHSLDRVSCLENTGSVACVAGF